MEVIKAAARQGSAVRESTALRIEGKSYTYVQLISFAWKISRLLCSGTFRIESAGVKGTGHLGGARIGIVAKPSVEFVAGLLGTWLSGGVVVPLAVSYPEAELFHVMNDSGVSVLLSTEDQQERMKNIAAECAATFSLIPSVSSMTTPHGKSEIKEVDIEKHLWEEVQHSDVGEENGPALIVYTSGTTGKSKGVVHTHKSINSQVKILTEAWEYSSWDQFLHCLPLHHVHGIFITLLAPLYAGAVVEFLPKFSVRGIWKRWRESYPTDGDKADAAITVFTGVPTMYTRLLQGYEEMDPDIKVTSASAASQLRLMMCASSALPHPVMEQWESITGHRLLERYGMTEYIAGLSNPLRGIRKGGTVGRPLPGVQVKILWEDECGNDTEGVGELCIKSPSLFKEYWKQPEVTKESFIEGGFFKTGDMVKVDEDGYFIILGRASADIMKVGGYKLSALEIETVLLEHPVVSECCVLGLPDKVYGEAVCAIIIPEADAKRKGEKEFKAPITLEELQTWAKEKLVTYKVPTILFLWDSLPRNAMGKCIIWYTLLLFLFEYREARNVIVTKINGSKDNTNNNGEHLGEDLHVIVAKPSCSESENSNNVSMVSKTVEDESKEIHLFIWRCGCCSSQGVCEESVQTCSKQEERHTKRKADEEKNQESIENVENFPSMTFEMLRMILKMVWFKLIRNPNSYASLLGFSWALASCRWGFKSPQIMQNSVTILSNAGLGMAMFSLGLFMALQPKIIACGNTLAAYGMIVRFVVGPAVMAVASIGVGLRGEILKVSIVQAALPQGIVPFVFAREYNLHPDVLSTSVIFGMIVSLPITTLYYVVLGL